MITDNERDLRRYNKGFRDGLIYRGTNTHNNPHLIEMLRGLKSADPLVKAYWQGYFDVIHMYQRNPYYCRKDIHPNRLLVQYNHIKLS